MKLHITLAQAVSLFRIESTCLCHLEQAPSPQSYRGRRLGECQQRKSASLNLSPSVAITTHRH